jgi:hypothetical protein
VPLVVAVFAVLLCGCCRRSCESGCGRLLCGRDGKRNREGCAARGGEKECKDFGFHTRVIVARLRPLSRNGPCDIILRMTKLLEDAIERLKELPEERQNELAEALIEAAKSEESEYQLSDEQVAEIERRRRVKNQKFVTLKQLDRRLARRRA